MKDTLTKNERSVLARTIEGEWVERGYPLGVWEFPVDSKAGVSEAFVLTTKVDTGLGERMRFVAQLPLKQTFVYYTH